uniref:N2 n=2 Tax=Ovis aries TaxID=9940 RepID=G0ZSA4_SHEEP|nr:N2 [Ovis aries]
MQLLKLVHLQPVFHAKRSHRNKSERCSEEWLPRSATRESLSAATEIQCRQPLIFRDFNRNSGFSAEGNLRIQGWSNGTDEKETRKDIKT